MLHAEIDPITNLPLFCSLGRVHLMLHLLLRLGQVELGVVQGFLHPTYDLLH